MATTKKTPSAPEKKASTRSFSSTEAIKIGFDLFKKNIITFIKLGAVLFAINIVTGILSSLVEQQVFANLIVSIASTALSILVQIGMIKILLDLYDGKKLDFTQLYSMYPLALRYLGASILYGLMVVVGIVLLIVPGIYLAIKYQFYSFLIIDKNMGIMDSFKKSGEMTKGNMMNLFFLGLILVVINIIGALLFGIGLLVTIPTSTMAMVYVYRKLSHKGV